MSAMRAEAADCEVLSLKEAEAIVQHAVRSMSAPASRAHCQHAGHTIQKLPVFAAKGCEGGPHRLA
jgi:hypothetical protein